MSRKDYLELAKPGITRMVMITAFLGYLMAFQSVPDWIECIAIVLGIGLSSAGACALNNFMERESDALMERTRNRAIPSGRVRPADALAYGVTLLFIGLSIILLVAENLLCAFLVLLSAFLYVVIYTPMKQRHWLNTTFGAIPGALPIACGYVGATHRMDFMAWVLFLILFSWQHPHFYAISWMYKEDYKKAGHKMLSVTDPSGVKLFAQVILYSFFLLAVSMMPYFLGNAYILYLIGAIFAGILMIVYSLHFVRRPDFTHARKLLFASLVYLPVLLCFSILDMQFKL